MGIDVKSKKFKVIMIVSVSFLSLLIFLIVVVKRFQNKAANEYALSEPDLETYVEKNKESELKTDKFDKSKLTGIFYQERVDSARIADSLEQLRLDSLKYVKDFGDKKIRKTAVRKSTSFKKDTSGYVLNVPTKEKKTYNRGYVPKKKKKTTSTVKPKYDPEVTFFFRTTNKYMAYDHSVSTEKGSKLSPKAKKYQAVIYGDQEVVNGGSVTIKSINDIRLKGKVIPKHSVFFGRATFNANRILVSIHQVVSPIGSFELAMTVYGNDYQKGIFHNFGFMKQQEEGVGGVALESALDFVPGPTGTALKSTKNISKKLLKAHEKPVFLKDGYTVYLKII